MDLSKGVKFAHPFMLLKQCQDLLEELGPEKFLHGADPRAHKGKEAFSALLFILSLKKPTGKDWWLLQPDEVFPDFQIMAFSEDESNPISVFAFELVTVPDQCSTFEQALEIVHGKILEKNYAPASKVNLLIFINNIQGQAWVSRLSQEIGPHPVFQEVWTIYLKARPGTNNIAGSVVDRISPKPVKHIPVSFSDSEVFRTQPLPRFIEEFSVNGQVYVKISDEMQKRIRNAVKKLKADK
jgi:hypothetical protein